MLEYIGGLLLVAAGAAMGDNAARTLSRREKELRDLKGLLEQIAVYLESYRLSTKEIFDRIAEKGGVYSEAFRLRGEDITIETANAIRTSGLEMCGRFAEYIEGFGRTDLSGQLAQNKIFMHDVSCEYDKAVEKRKKYSRIYRAAGISSGIIVALLLI